LPHARAVAAEGNAAAALSRLIAPAFGRFIGLAALSSPDIEDSSPKRKSPDVDDHHGDGARRAIMDHRRADEAKRRGYGGQGQRGEAQRERLRAREEAHIRGQGSARRARRLERASAYHQGGERFIDEHGLAEYARWHLGVDEEKLADTKGRYKFPYGDFRNVHRCAVLSAESRAGQYKHTDIELAAAHLHGMLDALM
jgi:hypothetical protein